MTLSDIQCYLTPLGHYKLKRKDGSPAIDGIDGPATRTAIYNFQLAHRKRPDGSILATDGVCGPATEKAIRQVIGANEPIQTPKPMTPIEPPTNPGTYRYISISDFKCRCGGRYCNGWPAQPHTKTLDILEQIGAHYGKRIIPHSGLRCATWNKLSGGVPNSKHLYGMAMDFHIEGVSHRDLYNYVDSLLGNTGGLGLYSWGVHVDDRPVKARW